MAILAVLWDEAGFEKLRDFVRENLNEVTVDIAQKVEQILSLNHALNQRLKGKMDFTMAFAFSDIKGAIKRANLSRFCAKEWLRSSTRFTALSASR